MKTSTRDQRKHARVSLFNEQFKFKENSKVYAVVDLSLEGMALRMIDQEDLHLFPIMRVIEGEMSLSGKKIRIRAKVVNIRQDIVGCEFEFRSSGLDTSAARELAEYLRPERLAQELKPMDAEDAHVTWYRSRAGTHILLRRNAKGESQWLGVFILGSFVEWRVGQGLSTGRVAGAADEAVAQGLARFDTMILDKDPKPDRGKCKIALDLIQDSELPKNLKAEIAKLIDGSLSQKE